MPTVELCGAQNNANMACVSEGVTTQGVGLGLSVTNRTLGHHGQVILSCPDSLVGKASALNAEGPGFNSQLAALLGTHIEQGI